MIRKCKSIREASRHLHISASALNRQLLELEVEVGTPLFERLRTGLKVTPAGEILSRHVQLVMQDAQRMNSELDAAKGLRKSVIEVVSAESLIADFLPRILADMTKLYPRVQVRVRVLGSLDAAMAVSSGSADLALCFIRQRMPELRQLAVGSFSFGAIVAPEHPLSTSGKVSISSCAAFPLVLPTPEISMREEVNSLLLPYQGQYQIVLESGSFELIRRQVMQGSCVAFSNPFGIEKELAERRLCYLPIKRAGRSMLGAYVRAKRTLPTDLATFAQLVMVEIDKREKLNA